MYYEETDLDQWFPTVTIGYFTKTTNGQALLSRLINKSEFLGVRLYHLLREGQAVLYHPL